MNITITTKIEVPAFLKEYCIGKYNNLVEGPIHFPDKLDIYHLIWDLLEKRPKQCSVDKGNLEILLPHRNLGKSPKTYNYLGERSVTIIVARLKTLFWAELHDFLDENKHRLGIEYSNAVHLFMRKYDINSITEDALLKNYQRWRDSIRKKKSKRGYKREKKEVAQV